MALFFVQRETRKICAGKSETKNAVRREERKREFHLSRRFCRPVWPLFACISPTTFVSSVTTKYAKMQHGLADRKHRAFQSGKKNTVWLCVCEKFLRQNFQLTRANKKSINTHTKKNCCPSQQAPQWREETEKGEKISISQIGADACFLQFS